MNTQFSHDVGDVSDLPASCSVVHIDEPQLDIESEEPLMNGMGALMLLLNNFLVVTSGSGSSYQLLHGSSQRYEAAVARHNNSLVIKTESLSRPSLSHLHRGCKETEEDAHFATLDLYCINLMKWEEKIGVLLHFISQSKWATSWLLHFSFC